MKNVQHPDGFIDYNNPNYVKLAEYIPAYDFNQKYGLGGYQGYSVDIALRRDDAEAIQKAHDFGWIKKDAVTLLGTPLLFLAIERGWTNVAEKLRELGYPLNKD